ncbi:type III pantothenate kinase [Agitococcus lubricus]|uniref:Type III pantothenate kinase n=1 Tax=Agitococcus lubricus TaxID=1077255 RepID=A0A2T5J0Q2_9GAMM|nr:type III pantothenate kinase [Agitococcus lubricus]PTQ89913.1 type III pantothenate kinase [Agitococcus lubricus]
MNRYCYIDIGNSRIKWWLCEQHSIVKRYVAWHTPTIAELLDELPHDFDHSVSFVGISSVQDDDYNQQLTQEIYQRWGIYPEFAVTQAVSRQIECAYDEPTKLGIDRWLNVLAVANAQPVCVVSCGTALTIDIVEDNRHLGGYIIPSLNLQLSALLQGTKRVKPEKITFNSLDLGTNTSQAVHHGILMACVAVIEKVHQQRQTSLQKTVNLVLTGGDAEKIGQHLSIEHVIIPELLLLGLQRYFGHSS